MDKKPKIREYQGKGVTIQYDVKRCIHSEECIHALPKVFNQHQRPWIQPGDTPAEALVDAVLRCPTGALHFVREDGGEAEQPPAKNRVWFTENGPLYVHGNIEIVDLEGNLLHKDTRIALCRCGESKNKPFCDNTHLETGFTADGAGTARASTEQLADSDVLRITVQPNKSLRFEGNFEVFNETGELLYSGCRTGICRCGASQQKPFCDSTHNKIGWTSD
ncbi:MAG: CDGSH iron-sulfur domain-containing protein [Anaerolineaceae bacterium]|jgi:CDGSH-type Zn-finger protein/uncharacterized Fe-S cluster protein YjdI|nr:CDGSH iron-sulfur domain-containing protein [Anaerolineaceae bacterium]